MNYWVLPVFTLIDSACGHSYRYLPTEGLLSSTTHKKFLNTKQRSLNIVDSAKCSSELISII